jgi:hypothetical protein
MTRDDLTTEQAATLNKSIRKHLAYLIRLRTRMEKAGFSLTDALLQSVTAAYNATYHLSVELHYLSCKSGVGRAPKE